jgi:mannose-6-phosphate isomerase
MGTHSSNPSADVVTGRTLLDMVQDNTALLSPAVAARYGKKLPFLFKVLSINQALSIQAHPNKKLAEQLHARDPKNYPDDNHKPEMTIAITEFKGLCGFRPPVEIAHFLTTVPPLRKLVGEEAASQFEETVKKNEGKEDDATKAENKRVLKSAFASLMSKPDTAIKDTTDELISLIGSPDNDFAGGAASNPPGSELADLVNTLHATFGPDHGLFVLFFLNYVALMPGEALFLQADDIHAYLSGDVIECMASSDNVVRAGLTPKFKDVNTLVDMLTYSYAPIEEQKMHAIEYPYATLNRAAYSSASTIELYDPPIDEFAVVRTLLRGDKSKATFDPLGGPSIIICTAGKGKISVGPTVEEMKEGYVYFVGATAEVVLESEASDREDEFITFKAFCEVEDHSNGASH